MAKKPKTKPKIKLKTKTKKIKAEPKLKSKPKFSLKNFKFTNKVLLLTQTWVILLYTIASYAICLTNADNWIWLDGFSPLLIIYGSLQCLLIYRLKKDIDIRYHISLVFFIAFVILTVLCYVFLNLDPRNMDSVLFTTGSLISMLLSSICLGYTGFTTARFSFEKANK